MLDWTGQLAYAKRALVETPRFRLARKRHPLVACKAALRLAEAHDALGDKAEAKAAVHDARVFESLCDLNRHVESGASVLRERKRREASLNMWAAESAALKLSQAAAAGAHLAIATLVDGGTPADAMVPGGGQGGIPKVHGAFKMRGSRPRRGVPRGQFRGRVAGS